MKSDTSDDESARAARTDLSIQDVSRILEVPAPTLRSWERRYGILAPGRSTGGHRRYSPQDVTVLRLMRDEVARGQRATDAAAWVIDQTSHPLPHQGPINDLVEAAQQLDSPRFTAILDASTEQVGVDVTTCEVLLPAMRRIGVWWQANRCDIVHEHLATEVAIAWLHRLHQPGGEPAGVILLACGPTDQHTIGLEVLAVMLQQRGWDARILGTRVPPASLAIAIEASAASAVVVVSQLAVSRRSAIESLAAASALDTSVFYAGNAFGSPMARRNVPGTHLGNDFIAAAETIVSGLGARRTA